MDHHIEPPHPMRVGLRIILFEVTPSMSNLDLAPDGKRFLIDTNQAPSRPVVVVLNWDAALKEK